MRDLTFEVDDLELDDIVVTSMRDTVALPESAASGAATLVPQTGSCNSCSCGSSSCCCTG